MSSLMSLDFYTPMAWALSYTKKVHNTKKRSRIYMALANQHLISGITRMKQTWNQSNYSNYTSVVDFETIEKGYGNFRCPSEPHHDLNYQAIIKSTIKCLLEEQPETETRNDILNIIDMKIIEECTLASLRQTTTLSSIFRSFITFIDF